MLFTRVYVKRPVGWQLLASMQYRNPNASAAPLTATLGYGTTADVMKADEDYRLARLHHDVAALGRLLSSEFVETNQNGNTRDKSQTLELWRNFAITSLTTDTFRVRMDGDTAMVTGTQTQDGTEHMLFTRVYVKRPAGWQLLASMQLRNPNAGGHF
jgi:hypothetical protein